MLGMTRWTPWTELAGVHRDLDSLFNRVFGDTVRSQSVDAFTPAADAAAGRGHVEGVAGAAGHFPGQRGHRYRRPDAPGTR